MFEASKLAKVARVFGSVNMCLCAYLQECASEFNKTILFGFFAVGP